MIFISIKIYKSNKKSFAAVLISLKFGFKNAEWYKKYWLDKNMSFTPRISASCKLLEKNAVGMFLSIISAKKVLKITLMNQN